MKISSSDVNLSSTESFQRTTAFSESLNFWTDDQSQSQGNFLQKDSFGTPAFLVDLSDSGKSLSSSQINATEESKITLTDKDKHLIALLEAFFERLTGKKHKFIFPRGEEDPSKTSSSSITFDPSRFNSRQLPEGNANVKVGWGLIYERHEALTESQSFQFNGVGNVKTADGRTIDFSLSLSMSRTFVKENNVSIKAGDALRDPLVINYKAATASLTKSKISIDIDNDGDVDQISNLAKGSGFLALDKNGDGKIDNGGELFGTQSGNGFSDLAAYDSDKNNWIDENDPIFNKLRIWTVDEGGKSQLVALGQQGVGAIYLGNVATQFDLKQGASTEGKIQRSGVFLNENGSAGTIQHVDLKV